MVKAHAGAEKYSVEDSLWQWWFPRAIENKVSIIKGKKREDGVVV